MDDGIFIWIPKNAGTSIYTSLHDDGCKLIDFEPKFKGYKDEGLNTFGHISTGWIKDNLASKEYFDNAFKFAFVRNPWSRAVSLYNYYQVSHRGHEVKRVTFKQFLYRINKGVPQVGKNTIIGLSQSNNQVDWLFHNDELLVDFIGRFENLERDYARIRMILNLPPRRLGHERKGSYDLRDYRKWYNKETANLIRRIYEKDIRTFGYKF